MLDNDDAQKVSKSRQVLFTVGNFGRGIFTSVTLFFQSAFLLEIAEVPGAYVNLVLMAYFCSYSLLDGLVTFYW